MHSRRLGFLNYNSSTMYVQSIIETNCTCIFLFYWHRAQPIRTRRRARPVFLHSLQAHPVVAISRQRRLPSLVSSVRHQRHCSAAAAAVSSRQLAAASAVDALSVAACCVLEHSLCVALEKRQATKYNTADVGRRNSVIMFDL